MKYQTYKKDDFQISTNPKRLNKNTIFHLISRTYWGKNSSKSTIKKLITHSLCYGVYQGRKQIGFGRVVTDYSTIAYLTDFIIKKNYQGRGLGGWLIECVKKHPELQHLRGWILKTRDAHGLYKKYGFKPIKKPERYMEIFDYSQY